MNAVTSWSVKGIFEHCIIATVDEMQNLLSSSFSPITMKSLMNVSKQTKAVSEFVVFCETSLLVVPLQMTDLVES